MHVRVVRRPARLVVIVVGLLVVAAACGSSAKSSPPVPSSSSSLSSSVAPGDASLGQGVSADEIQVGVMMIDYSCIEQFVDAVEPDQQQAFQIFVDDINAKGGIAGRKLVPVYKSYCPIRTTTELSACTSLTDDSKVFAAIGTFYDPSGDAQCASPSNTTRSSSPTR
jgi:ABC-type branched-subunit amino acid transport system substrate-binding protein